MKLIKGDKIRLVKPMGAFKNVGEECEVLNIDEDGVIEFRFGGCHKGYMSPDECDKYFEKVQNEEEAQYVAEYEIGDTVKMVKENKALAPMEVGNEYAIQSIGYGVIALLSVDTGAVNYISQQLFEDHFAVVVEDVMDESGAFTPDAPLTVSMERVEEVMNHSKVVVYKAFDKCTVVMCQLPNGFVLVESSACVDPENYDEQIGMDICLNRIKDRVFEMEAYKLQADMKEYNDAVAGLQKSVMMNS